jgi:hypothetical protein
MLLCFGKFRTGLESGCHVLGTITTFFKNATASVVATISNHVSLAAIRFLLSSVMIAVLLTPIAKGQDATPAEDGWPRSITSAGYQIEVYQPQVDKWQGGKLEGRAAVMVQQDGVTDLLTA